MNIYMYVLSSGAHVCMYACMYFLYVYACMYDVFKHAYVYTYIRIYVYMYTQATYVYTCIRTHVYTDELYLGVASSMHVCMHVLFVCVCMHV